MLETINEVINNIGSFGPLLGCLFIIIESMIPILPLCVFIVINFLAFGSFLGLIISWIFTVLGCMIAFFIVRNGLQKTFNKKIRKVEQINNLMKKVDGWKFQDLVVIMAIPFTPAFAINIASALADINPKKYLYALLIGKFFMVFFWGFVGVSFVDCLTNPLAIIKIVFLVSVSYFFSKVVSKKLNID